MSTDDPVELEPVVTEVEQEEINISFTDLLQALAQAVSPGAAGPGAAAGLVGAQMDQMSRVSALATQLHAELSQIDSATVEQLVQQALDPRSATPPGT